MADGPRLTPESKALLAGPTLPEQIADLKATLLEEADTYRVVLHTLSNSMNAMNLKLEVILQHIRGRGE